MMYMGGLQLLYILAPTCSLSSRQRDVGKCELSTQYCSMMRDSINGILLDALCSSQCSSLLAGRAQAPLDTRPLAPVRLDTPRLRLGLWPLRAGESSGLSVSSCQLVRVLRPRNQCKVVVL